MYNIQLKVPFIIPSQMKKDQGNQGQVGRMTQKLRDTAEQAQ